MNVAKAPQLLLGLVFLGAGGQKLKGTDTMVDQFARFRYPQWFRVVTGAVEVAGAVGMLAGLRRPALVPVAGALLAATMVGAVASHVRAGDPASAMARPAVLLATAAAVARPARRSGAASARTGDAAAVAAGAG
jgi:putative oxidoreductase